MLIAGIEKSQIKWDKNQNDNREIIEVPGVYENPRRQTLTVYVKCLKCMKLVEFDTKFTNK
jgi:hypothetical protein